MSSQMPVLVRTAASLLHMALMRLDRSMFTGSTPLDTMQPIRERVAIAKRRPVRVTITVSFQVFDAITSQADYQGRSTSNYAAFLLEDALNAKALAQG